MDRIFTYYTIIQAMLRNEWFKAGTGTNRDGMPCCF